MAKQMVIILNMQQRLFRLITCENFLTRMCLFLHADDSSQWVIPITIAIGKNSTKKIMLDTKSLDVTLDDVSSSEYVMVSKGELCSMR